MTSCIATAPPGATVDAVPVRIGRAAVRHRAATGIERHACLDGKRAVEHERARAGVEDEERVHAVHAHVHDGEIVPELERDRDRCRKLLRVRCADARARDGGHGRADGTI